MMYVIINGEQIDVDLDLGAGYFGSFCRWAPNRDLNPHYADVPDIEKACLVIYHPLAEPGKYCIGMVNFETPDIEKIFGPNSHRWKVESMEPLTLSPSIFCRQCNDHGFIREGKWVKA
jgi:hypothetical protein